jgi:hypothetical protein
VKASDLDRDRLTINAQQWFALCLPGGNPVTASSWRKQAGIGNQRVRRISQYHAFLILVRSRLAEICIQLGEPKPRVAEVDCFVLEALGDRWLAAVQQRDRGDDLARLLTGGEITIEDISEVLAQSGVGKSPTTQRRYLRRLGLRPSLSRNQRLTNLEAHVLRLGLALRVHSGGAA